MIQGDEQDTGRFLALCTACWRTVHPHEATCQECSEPQPALGWPRLPYRFQNRFEFQALLGRGAMAAVFRAVDLETHAAFAIKVPIRPRWFADPAAINRWFQKEQMAAGLLGGASAHFVRVDGYESGVPIPYLKMEIVEWPTLEQYLQRARAEQRQPVVSYADAARIGVALLRGVEEMHNVWIIHRDLKPSNLFVKRDSMAMELRFRVKISDLGVWAYDRSSRRRMPGDPSTIVAGKVLKLSPGPGRTVDAPGHPVGTPEYMSPEQFRQDHLSVRSDLHAVGAILWELVTGEPPYPLDRAGLDDDPGYRRRLDEMRASPPRPEEMPERFHETLVRALAFDPAARWASAREMRRALEEQFRLAEEGRRAEREALEERLGRLEFRIHDAVGLGRGIAEQGAALEERLAALKANPQTDEGADFGSRLAELEVALQDLLQGLDSAREPPPARVPSPWLSSPAWLFGGGAALLFLLGICFGLALGIAGSARQAERRNRHVGTGVGDGSARAAPAVAAAPTAGPATTAAASNPGVDSTAAMTPGGPGATPAATAPAAIPSPGPAPPVPTQRSIPTAGVTAPAGPVKPTRRRPRPPTKTCLPSPPREMIMPTLNAAKEACVPPHTTPGRFVLEFFLHPDGRLAVFNSLGEFANSKTALCIKEHFSRTSLPCFDGSPQRLSFVVSVP